MRLLAFGVSLLLSLPALAQPRQLSVDGAASRLGFDAKTTFHEFSGRAGQLSGTLDLVDGRPMSGTVTCSAASLVTGSDGRDHDMRGSKYLDVTRFPDIVFTFGSLDGQAIPATGEAQGTLHGTLEVVGRSVPVAVPVTYGWQGDRLEVRGSFPLDIRTVGLVPPVIMLIQRMDPVVKIGFALVFR